jgi:ribosomal protein S18 acetylase RimI-like enzyme
MGVVQPSRGQEVGTSLIDALINSARTEHVTVVSPSVEPDNHARHLYERFGQVGEVAGFTDHAPAPVVLR